MYARVAELDTSEVKVCIQIGYFGAWGDWRDVDVLETLTVKVGPFVNDETTSKTRILPLQLILTRFVGKSLSYRYSAHSRRAKIER